MWKLLPDITLVNTNVCGTYCLISPGLNRLLALTMGVVSLDSSVFLISSPLFEVELSVLSTSFLLVKVWSLSPW